MTKYYSETTYVDVETGEVLWKYHVNSKEYKIINKTINYESKGEYTLKKVINHCERTKQLAFDFQ